MKTSYVHTADFILNYWPAALTLLYIHSTGKSNILGSLYTKFDVAHQVCVLQLEYFTIYTDCHRNYFFMQNSGTL